MTTKITTTPSPLEVVDKINAVIDDATNLSTTVGNKLDKTGTAAKATADASGNNITNTYATKAQAVTSLSSSGTTVTYTKADGSTGTFTTQDTKGGYHTGNAISIGSASATEPAVVVESYRSGNTWYRKYSDGWIEQGGEFAGHERSDTVYSYNFAKAFASPAATVIFTTVNFGHYGLGSEISLSGTTTTQFKVKFCAENNTTVGTCRYYACGY